MGSSSSQPTRKPLSVGAITATSSSRRLVRFCKVYSSGPPRSLSGIGDRQLGVVGDEALEMGLVLEKQGGLVVAQLRQPVRARQITLRDAGGRARASGPT